VKVEVRGGGSSGSASKSEVRLKVANLQRSIEKNNGAKGLKEGNLSMKAEVL
jgi:hypothetical protein